MAYKKIISEIKRNSPVLMGVLNVTPDSFSDGGRHFNPTIAIKQAKLMVKQGAFIIDVGGESSRPGSKPVSITEELRRVVPVIKTLSKQVLISIDTYKPAVAAVALKLGAKIVNDISGLRDPLMRKVVAQEQCPVILMHMLGEPSQMQNRPRYKDVVQDIKQFFRDQINLATTSGINRKQIIIDPGIGFGKTVHHNFEILNNIKSFTTLNLPILIGASRKSFIGKLTGAAVEDRLPGTLAAHLRAVQQGADILRVHDVAEHQQALRVFFQR